MSAGDERKGSGSGSRSDPKIAMDATTPLPGSSPDHTASIAHTPARGPSDLPRFPGGTLVAGRYKVVRFLAEGGMGEVYEAEDLALGERVALKTVRPRTSSDKRTVELDERRFKREIQLARKVTHPNVCRIFDVGFHKGEGDAGDVTFLTMELLEGETLAERLRRDGRMSAAGARPLVEQMADALAAAHEAGIVHRDFKSANVMLVKRGDSVRAVVTDFGLARGAGGDAAITGGGGIVGSPAYMAPEQVEGGDVGAAADVYALGVVMYEMLTGRVPFVGENPLATAVKRLKEKPAPPSKHAPDVPAAWEEAILAALELEPAKRPSGPLAVVRMLDGASRGASRRRAGVAVAIALGGALIAVIVGARSMRTRTAEPPRAPAAAMNEQPVAAERRSLAVMGFKNLSGDAGAGWLSDALVELFATELAAGDDVRLIPSESVSRTRRSLAIEQTELYAADTLGKLRRSLGADLVVVGSYLPTGEKIRLDLKVQDTTTGETVATVAEDGTAEELVELVSRSSARLRERLGLGTLSAAEAAAARAALPASTDAVRNYTEGLAQLRNYECLRALPLLEKAVTADEKHAAARAALGETRHCLGYEEQGLADIQQAFNLSANLPAGERRRIEATLHKFKGNHKEATKIYREIYESDPQDIEAGILFLQTFGKGKAEEEEAWALLAELRKKSDDSRLDVAELSLRARRNDIEGSLDLARRAAEKARARGERAFLAMLLSLEAEVLAMRGDFDGAIRAAEASNVESIAVGDRDGVCMGNIIIGRAHLFAGRADQARRVAEETLALANGIGAMRRVRQSLNLLADIAINRGNLAQAQVHAEELAAIGEKLDNDGWTAGSLYLLGALNMLRGDLAGAEERWRKAKALDQSGGYIGKMAMLLEAEAILLRGEVAGARKRVQEAAVELGPDATDRPEAALVMADIALAEGRPAEAERLLQKMLEYYRPEQRERRADVALLEIMLAQALYEQGKIEEAKEILERVKTLRARSGSMMLALQSVPLEARLRARADDTAGARQMLHDALGEASRSGFVREEFEIRLVLGELEMKSDLAAGRARLQDLIRDAKAKGFGLYARKAALSRT